MKFIYIDESGDRGGGDVFVMCGLMVDAYKLRKKTADFDRMLGALHAKYPSAARELKTSQFLNGKKPWSKIPPQERKDFIQDVCRLAVDNGGKLFGYGLSYERFDTAKAAFHGHPSGDSYWLASGMFTAALVQKKMQGVKGGKGLTVMIMDDHKMEMPGLSDGLYMADEWYDGLFQERKKVRGKSTWGARKAGDRFDQIINTAFAIKSDHSSLVQVADVISYVYRRHLELKALPEKYPGEREYYEMLVGILEPQREKLGQTPAVPCVAFYKAAVHPNWPI
ncbi:DUF3800 domain-containing protein [Pseudoponticoccus marisrubri]|uniref:DUF3800 domain-containing protein n=1 Tax=Pseudoponticoccus marisrubri TaxID=1685382 RepID=A0A0W7WEG2_9RHOB|nr:DUF3800 domain-containing protein [Pseudoponticoccus marisrubri]KUF09040.1 hypothetical protein AVJ23_19795 [Pseudoponticoccus marisrubri]